MEIEGVFIDNCSHGYLAVSRTDFVKVMASTEEKKKITGYSGLTKDKVYLEEDLDAGTFITIAKSKGYTVSLTDSYQPSFECSKNYSASKVN